MTRRATALPVLATLAGVGIYAVMDAAMKGSALAIGTYSALLWRSLVAVATVVPAWRLAGGTWPAPATLRLHLTRGVVAALMALTFFFGLTRLPMAEAIAISFIAPLIALYLAAVMLGERIRRSAVAGSVLGLGGVALIAGTRIGAEDAGEGALLGIAAILASALLYAWNLILQRRQSQVAGPLEVAAFQNGTLAALLVPFAAAFAVAPPSLAVAGLIGAATMLAVMAGMLFSWAYARAEAQALVPLEYAAFPFAATMGWLAFGEALEWPTVAGTVLVVTGCWIAVPRSRPEADQV